MPTHEHLDALRKSTVALELLVAFHHDEQATGRGTAIQNLSIGLKREGLWLGRADDALLNDLRAGLRGFDELQAELCSSHRTGYDGPP
jgi:hypothetical protein